jgi:hypothetical protein
MDEIEYLEALIALLSRPGSWTQGALARDAKGEHCSTFSKEAASRCLLGALTFVSYGGYGIRDHPDHPGYPGAQLCLQRQAIYDFGTHSLGSVNDAGCMDHESMLAFLRRTLNRAKIIYKAKD